MTTKANARNIVGNCGLIERIKTDVMSNTLSHAYIIEGRKGSGKHTIANLIAFSLVCRYSPKNKSAHTYSEISMFDDISPDTDTCERSTPCCFSDGDELCPSCKKLLELKCPDVYIIGRDGKATLGVETVRGIRSSVHLSPIDNETKIYIIEDADTMTVQAQNALLLTLEEPPSYALFLLLASNSEALLETIRSRAPVLRTENLTDAQVTDYLLQNVPEAKTLYESDREQFMTVIINADGCIGRALDLIDAKERKKILQRRAVADSFVSLCCQKKAANLPQIIPEFGNKRDEAIEILRFVSLALRDLLLIKRTDSVCLKYYVDAERAFEISSSFTSREILSVYNAVQNAIISFERNGNLRLTLTRMCIDAIPT